MALSTIQAESTIKFLKEMLETSMATNLMLGIQTQPAAAELLKRDHQKALRDISVYCHNVLHQNSNTKLIDETEEDDDADGN